MPVGQCRRLQLEVVELKKQKMILFLIFLSGQGIKVNFFSLRCSQKEVWAGPRKVGENFVWLVEPQPRQVLPGIRWTNYEFYHLPSSSFPKPTLWDPASLVSSGNN